MEDVKKILTEFVDWLEWCGEDAFYAFDNKSEAVDRFIKEKNPEP